MQQQYGTNQNESSVSESVKNATREVRIGFVRKVYSILAVQLLLTTAIAAPIVMQSREWATNHQWMLGLSLVGYMSMVCVMCCCQQVLRKFPTNYIFLFAITLFMSVIVGFAASMYTIQSILMCVGITGLIFIGMTAYAWNTTSDFTGAGPYLFAAMLCLMMFGFTLSIMRMCGVAIPPGMELVYDIGSVLLFTFFIVYDTQLMMGELGGHQIAFGIDDYVFAALNLYIDIIQLFMHLLKIFGQRR